MVWPIKRSNILKAGVRKRQTLFFDAPRRRLGHRIKLPQRPRRRGRPTQGEIMATIPIRKDEPRRERLLSAAIAERRATPSFDGSPVRDEDLHRILDAGIKAPSGYNIQPWRFVVVRSPE